MKRNWLSSVAFSALAIATGAVNLATPAAAADLPVIAEPLFTWSGPYIGGHVGGAFGEEEDDQSEFFPDRPVPADEFDVDGFVGGVHVGFNWQAANRFVLGIEGDIDFANVEGDAPFSYLGGGYAGTLSLESDWQGSLRLRAGYGFDYTLLYVTGGVAFANAELRAKGYNDFIDEDFDNSDSNVHVGWTVGLGVEHAFTENWIGRLEARFTDFGDETYDLDNSGEVESGWNQTSVILGFSYKF